ncbi:aldose 1-epimerase [Chitinophaga sp. 30R24]|uniref:aldose 1-epimerase n=1 Tax=Chitinophaga sp. 30R24 TaxID=3248838 RepID=UPI003B8F120C
MKFGIHSLEEAGFDIVALRDQETGTQVEIIPAFGALLHAFKVKRQQETLNLIDSYKDLQDLQDNLRKSFKSVKLSPYVCRMKNAAYTWEGRDYSIRKTIAPGNAIHGLLYDAPFTVTSRQANNQQAAVTLAYHFSDTTDAGYPFAYDCIVTYTLLPNNILQLVTTIVNKSGCTIPIVDGWHPYFTTGTPVDELELTFASTEKVEFNEQLLPTGKLLPCTDFAGGKLLKDIALDNSFILDFARPQPLATIHDPKKNINIAFYPGKCYPVIQIYTPPHRTSIAVENLSGAPDAFNNGIGLAQLAPGASQEFDVRIAITVS